MPSRSDFALIASGLALLAVICFGFWISVIAIHSGDVKSRTTSASCPMFPQGFSNTSYHQDYYSYISEPLPSSFQLKKQIWEMWNWQYNMDLSAHSITMTQACYSINHDVHAQLDGVLSFRTDGKVLSTTSDILVWDCHGKHVFTLTTGSFWITLENQIKIQVNFQLRDAAGTTLAYVQGTDLWTISKSFTFVDAVSGEKVVTASKDITTFPWTWNAAILNTNSDSPIVNPSLLGLVFAHSSFSETDSDGNDVTDMCNNYFLYTCILDGIATFGVLVACIWVFWDWIEIQYNRCRGRGEGVLSQADFVVKSTD
jgi:uncharacterized protein YxjI